MYDLGVVRTISGSVMVAELPQDLGNNFLDP